MSSVFIRRQLLPWSFALLGLVSASCGRVGVILLPLPVHGDSGMPDGGAAEGGSDMPDAATDAASGGDASTGDAGRDASSSDASAGDASAGDAGSDAEVVGGGMCIPTAGSGNDTTCDGADDDCNGAIDEDYVVVPQCGQGYCRTTSVASHCTAGVETLCTPGAPRSSDDRTSDGIDDDCDGQVDEDVCVPETRTFGAGTYTVSPPRGCTSVTVKLWGGGGASGNAQAGYWLNVTGGNGGPGGYASSVLTVSASSMLQLYVGGGGMNCPAPGAGGIAAVSGGAGGTSRAQAGTRGADGSLTGGSGGNASSGGDGGAGSLGGGGGGAGTDPGFAPHGGGGGGGAATTLSVGSTTLIAGGGGGGGGAGSDITTAGHSGGNGGSGCNGNGATATNEGGGGGGGGVCQGSTRMAGSNRLPYDPNGELSGNAARGGDGASDCDPGGNGFATLSFGP